MDLRSRIRVDTSWETHGDITAVLYIVSRSVKGVAGRTYHTVEVMGRLAVQAYCGLLDVTGQAYTTEESAPS